LRKRFHILLVARDAEGQLLKIPIPLHYLYVFLAGAVIGMLTITGMAGSYTRMLVKVARFNQLRREKEALKNQYVRLEQVAQEDEIHAASLGSLASEVASLYGLKPEALLTDTGDDGFTPQKFASSLDQFYTLRKTAMTGVATVALSFGPKPNSTTADWMRLAAAPTLWPVEGPVTGSFGERIDPFNGEGSFHRGVDISSALGHAIVAPANGVVLMTSSVGGYGRAILINHGHNISTLYGHLSSYAVAPGQAVRRGDTIGYVGLSGRSTGPHLHYEVRIGGTPVNPYKYLRATWAQTTIIAGGS